MKTVMTRKRSQASFLMSPLLRSYNGLLTFLYVNFRQLHSVGPDVGYERLTNGANAVVKNKEKFQGFDRVPESLR